MNPKLPETLPDVECRSRSPSDTSPEPSARRAKQLSPTRRARARQGAEKESLANQYRELRQRYSLRGWVSRDEKGLQLLHAIAKLRGGECLAQAYISKDAHYRFRCAAGHEWETSLGSVLQRTWCAVCIGRLSKPAHIEQLQAIAKDRGGTLLTKTYVNNRVPLQWRCARGHVWWATASNVKAGHWCARCLGFEQFEKLKAIAAARGGELVSRTYVDCATPLKWRCSQGHVWQNSSQNIKQGAWCPECRGHLSPERKLRKMQQIAAAQGGNCLSTVYINNRTPLRWRCREGHEWVAIPGCITMGNWCRRCAAAARRMRKAGEARGR